ncbi:MAG: low temperature requirement protein A [Burkholderiales bacterium]|nr:low temperature requirement protein A [Burkholderiales bacterium]
MSATEANPFLRDRNTRTRVTNEELFFDLIYAFAVTQLSHRLLEQLTPIGALQTLVLWFAVWLGWQYTAWVTNWFNPENRGMRIMLFAVMLLGLLMSSAIPDAFAARGLLFSSCLVAIQVGRSAFVLFKLRASHALRMNFVRIFGWLCISGALWIAGGLSRGDGRLAFWIAAVGCEYVSPMTGFWLPGLGRSVTSDWTIDGAHLAERCQLFVIVALGESILATGSGFSSSSHWDAPTFIALLVAFAGSLAMWWIYFDTASEHGTLAIVGADDPGRIGARFHYIHVTLIAGIIVAAVADELTIHQPGQRVDLASASVLVGGPLIYLLGNAAYKKVVYGWFPPSHIAGVALLLLTIAGAFRTDRLMVGGLTTAILIGVAAWQSRHAPAMPGRGA